ncbi:MAG: SLC13/DASS family transporter [Xanthomonadales bacterium]|nr:SLC13 family permease [Gammaproteobacteria bacterium]MBT8055154.1 SLC13 family permease [Gammaproteobacteria bacterium]NND58357.1 SLC13/DASS family transporter [Xanthomonadales bacterium]NNK51748.1 SLC13/DASS family transporter [Xanthomonadales bacterium]
MTRWLLVIAPAASLALFFLLLNSGWSAHASITAAVTLLCATWWIFEPVPIPFTSLIPLAVFPLLGVLTPAQVGQSFGSPLILLLMGGFMLSTAMADSGAHRRIALFMVNLFGGGNARGLVLGFMAAAAVLSMWISNTATTLMLLPVALAVLEQTEKKMQIPLLLGIAYAASIGGLGTPIGTPPNLIFMQVHLNQFGFTPSFPQWMSWGVPVVILLVPLAGLWLTRGVRLAKPVELPAVGEWRSAEKRVLIMFSMTAFFWITRQAPFGGWSGMLDLPMANDASVALIAVVLMAALPNGEGGRLLNWESASKIPWGVLLLFAGGIAIANAFVQSGLADHLAQQLSGLARLPTWLLLLSVCLSVTFLTEVTSNTATASLLMPVLAVTATATGINPMLLMVPAVLSASCAFMLPVATAPNAIVFGSGKVKIKEMARAGFALNIIGAFVITAVCLLLVE